MSPRRASRTLIALFGCLAAAAGGLVLARQPVPAAGQSPAAPAPAPPADDRSADRDAVRKAIDGLVAAFHKGDAKVVAAHWTAEGEYTDDDGTTVRGRPALEKAYAEHFAKTPDNALEVEVDTIRFPSRDTAVVEGHFKLRRGAKKELVVSRCSFLFAREGGAWLIAIAREWPGDGLTVRDLEWLIGSWEAKQGGTVVTTTYEWTPNKSFIRCRFSITRDGDTDGGMQMLGKDPAAGTLKVWTFEDEGGVGESDVTRDGKNWVYAARGVTADGRVLTATNIMTPVDADSFVWLATGRTLDGEDLPDLPPVKVVRVKSKP